MDIPNLPISPMVNEEGYPSDVELNFRQNLISALQQGAGPEGLVAPSQPTANITKIAANQLPNGEYTAQGGTIIYDSATDTLKVIVLVAGVPTVKTFTVT